MISSSSAPLSELFSFLPMSPTLFFSLSLSAPWLACFLIQQLSRAGQYPPNYIQSSLAELKPSTFQASNSDTVSCSTLGLSASRCSTLVLSKFPALSPPCSFLPSLRLPRRQPVGEEEPQLPGLAFLDLQASKTPALVLEVRLYPHIQKGSTSSDHIPRYLGTLSPTEAHQRSSL